MIKKKRNNKKKKSINKRSFKVKHSSILVFSVFILILLVSLLLIYQPSVGVGKAYQSITSSVPGEMPDLSVFLDFSEGYAAPGDQDITIPLKVRVGQLGDPNHVVRFMQFCLKYPYDKFDVKNLVVTRDNWKLVAPLPPTTPETWFAEVHDEGNDYSCPGGYTKFGNIAISTGGIAITDDTVIGQITFSVEEDSSYSNNGPEVIEILTVDVGGAMADDPTDTWNAAWNGQDDNKKQSFSNVHIVPRCNTVDKDPVGGDGYPDGDLTFEAFNDNLNDDFGDWRACKKWDPDTMYIDDNNDDVYDIGDIPTLNGIADCNDNDKEMYPGNNEICDGKDNDCNEGTEDGSGESTPLNSKQKGVCFGTYQTCQSVGVGGAEMQDNWPPEYNVVEQCDFVDHDCDGNPITHTNDGVVTEIEECQIGGSTALPFDAGNLYPTWNGNEPAENQEVNLFDLHIESLYQDLSDKLNSGEQEDQVYVNGKPLCGNFLAGYLCVCKNGNHYLSLNQDGSEVNLVDYTGETKEPVDGFSVDSNNLDLMNDDVLFMGCNE